MRENKGRRRIRCAGVSHKVHGSASTILFIIPLRACSYSHNTQFSICKVFSQENRLTEERSSNQKQKAFVRKKYMQYEIEQRKAKKLNTKAQKHNKPRETGQREKKSPPTEPSGVHQFLSCIFLQAFSAHSCSESHLIFLNTHGSNVAKSVQ